MQFFPFANSQIKIIARNANNKRNTISMKLARKVAENMNANGSVDRKR